MKRNKFDEVRKIEVILPDKEELEKIESLNIDIEMEYTRAFSEELKRRLDEIRKGGK